MAKPATRIFNIPADAPFLAALVDALYDGKLFAGQDFNDPFVLSSLTIYLPNRRAVRALRECFLERCAGRSLILPSILPLGEVSEEEMSFAVEEAELASLDVPEAVSALERDLVLAQLTQPFMARMRQSLDDERLKNVIVTPSDALNLARSLSRFMDEVETEKVSLDQLNDLVPQELSQHFSLTLDFLEIVKIFWPEWLKDAGLISPANRRNAMLKLLAERYDKGLEKPVIIAGSTGSVPASAELMQVVGRDPLGAVILPGLDNALDDASFAAITAKGEEDCGHPQYGLAKLLQRFGIARGDVVALAQGDEGRAGLIAEIMRPAETLEAWANAPAPPLAACEGIALLEAENSHQEALAIALAMRHAAGEGKSANLVTPDRALAMRVSLELRRWGIEVDDSAGKPLSQTPPGIFIRLAANWLNQPFSGRAMMALLKHPVARLGKEPYAIRQGARALELAVLRGAPSYVRFEDMTQALEMVEAIAKGKDRSARQHSAVGFITDEMWQDARDILQVLEMIHHTFWQRLDASNGQLCALVDALRMAAEDLADNGGDIPGDILYQREAGEALDRLLAALCSHSEMKMAVRAVDLGGLMTTLMGSISVRLRQPASHNLHILGLLEARLQGADLVILGGLNDGVWPDIPQNDGWLSRPMRAQIGLPPPERRVGLAAHDFAQGLGAPRVILSRALKDGSGPTVASRWWQRLQAYVEGRGLSAALGRLEPYNWQSLAKDMLKVGETGNAEPPAPCPPLEHRPRALSVTRVEEWIRNPYATYARSILKLEKLKPLDMASDAAERGNLFHSIFERYGRLYPEGEPANPFSILVGLGEEAFRELPNPAERAFWWPRYVEAARWFVDEDEDLRSNAARQHVELYGRLEIVSSPISFTLSARADRIDELKNGGYAAYDYKTGTAPSKKQIESHLSPQLSLTAAMLENGGFAEAGLPSAPVMRFAYLHLSGKSGEGASLIEPERPVSELSAEALEGLEKLVIRYADPSMPYEAMRRPQFKYQYDDYAHLARVKEWYGIDEGGADG